MIEILLSSFDQAKLESFISKIPEALVSESREGNSKLKLYRFADKENFQINCRSVFENGSKVPNQRSCDLQVNGSLSGEQIRVSITDNFNCEILKKYLPYGALHSTEYFYGKSSDGTFQNIFKYSFHAKKNCEASFGVKE